MNNDRDWIELKKRIRQARTICHGIKPIEDGIRCFNAVDKFQDDLRKIFMEKRRRRMRR